MAKMHKKIALCRPLDQRINDRIRPEENYIACSKLFLVDLLAPILLGTQADTKFSKIVQNDLRAAGLLDRNIHT